MFREPKTPEFEPEFEPFETKFEPMKIRTLKLENFRNKKKRKKEQNLRKGSTTLFTLSFYA